MYKQMYLINNFENAANTEPILNRMIQKQYRFKNPWPALCAVSALVWPMP